MQSDLGSQSQVFQQTQTIINGDELKPRIISVEPRYIFSGITQNITIKGQIPISSRNSSFSIILTSINTDKSLELLTNTVPNMECSSNASSPLQISQGITCEMTLLLQINLISSGTYILRIKQSNVIANIFSNEFIVDFLPGISLLNYGPLSIFSMEQEIIWMQLASSPFSYNISQFKTISCLLARQAINTNPRDYIIISATAIQFGSSAFILCSIGNNGYRLFNYETGMNIGNYYVANNYTLGLLLSSVADAIPSIIWFQEKAPIITIFPRLDNILTFQTDLKNVSSVGNSEVTLSMNLSNTNYNTFSLAKSYYIKLSSQDSSCNLSYVVKSSKIYSDILSAKIIFKTPSIKFCASVALPQIFSINLSVNGLFFVPINQSLQIYPPIEILSEISPPAAYFSQGISRIFIYLALTIKGRNLPSNGSCKLSTLGKTKQWDVITYGQIFSNESSSAEVKCRLIISTNSLQAVTQKAIIELSRNSIDFSHYNKTITLIYANNDIKVSEVGMSNYFSSLPSIITVKGESLHQNITCLVYCTNDEISTIKMTSIILTSTNGTRTEGLCYRNASLDNNSKKCTVSIIDSIVLSPDLSDLHAATLKRIDFSLISLPSISTMTGLIGVINKTSGTVTSGMNSIKVWLNSNTNIGYYQVASPIMKLIKRNVNQELTIFAPCTLYNPQTYKNFSCTPQQSLPTGDYNIYLSYNNSAKFINTQYIYSVVSFPEIITVMPNAIICGAPSIKGNAFDIIITSNMSIYASQITACKLTPVNSSLASSFIVSSSIDYLSITTIRCKFTFTSRICDSQFLPQMAMLSLKLGGDTDTGESFISTFMELPVYRAPILTSFQPTYCLNDNSFHRYLFFFQNSQTESIKALIPPLSQFKKGNSFNSRSINSLEELEKKNNAQIYCILNQQASFPATIIANNLLECQIRSAETRAYWSISLSIEDNIISYPILSYIPCLTVIKLYTDNQISSTIYNGSALTVFASWDKNYGIYCKLTPQMNAGISYSASKVSQINGSAISILIPKMLTTFGKYYISCQQSIYYASNNISVNIAISPEIISILPSCILTKGVDNYFLIKGKYFNGVGMNPQVQIAIFPQLSLSKSINPYILSSCNVQTSDLINCTLSSTMPDIGGYLAISTNGGSNFVFASQEIYESTLLIRSPLRILSMFPERVMQYPMMNIIYLTFSGDLSVYNVSALVLYINSMEIRFANENSSNSLIRVITSTQTDNSWTSMIAKFTLPNTTTINSKTLSIDMSVNNGKTKINLKSNVELEINSISLNQSTTIMNNNNQLISFVPIFGVNIDLIYNATCSYYNSFSGYAGTVSMRYLSKKTALCDIPQKMKTIIKQLALQSFTIIIEGENWRSNNTNNATPHLIQVTVTTDSNSAGNIVSLLPFSISQIWPTTISSQANVITAYASLELNGNSVYWINNTNGRILFESLSNSSLQCLLTRNNDINAIKKFSTSAKITSFANFAALIQCNFPINDTNSTELQLFPSNATYTFSISSKINDNFLSNKNTL